MPEKSISIPLQETGLNLHGTLRGRFEDPTIIIIPGMGGDMNDLLSYNASRYFENQGLSSLRLSLNSGAFDQRNIKDCDINTFLSDIDDAVDFVKHQRAPWICTLGHSFGSMAILYSKKQAFDAAILWDPSHTDNFGNDQSSQNLAKHFFVR